MAALLMALGLVLAVGLALGALAYVAWRGSKQSDFFTEVVKTSYDIQLPEADIDMYYELKDKLFEALQLQRKKRALAAGNADAVTPSDDDGSAEPQNDLWVRDLQEEERNMLKGALVRRLVGDIELLSQIQRDKPGNWKLWRGKLVSEQYWSSLCDAERLVGEEVDACLAEADILEPGLREHIFGIAVQHWRASKAQEAEKKARKKAVEQQKKDKEKEGKRKEIEDRLAEDQKKKQERLAEKAMEQLLREEENQSKSAKGSKGAKAAAKPKAGAKAPTSGKKK